MLDALTFQAGYSARVVALGVGALGAVGGVLGVFILLKRRALVADAAAHATLPGFAAAFLAALALGLDPKAFAVLATGGVAAGALALLLVRRLEAVPRLKSDAAIGVVLSGSYALGLVLLSVVQALPVGGQAGLAGYLLGSTAGLLAEEALASGLAALTIAAILGLLARPLTALSFDREAAAVAGLPTVWLDGIVMALLLLFAAVALRSVGAILMVALLVTPAVTARLWVERVPGMLALAGLFGAGAAHLGVAASASLPNLPAGPAVVLSLAALFAASLLLAPRRGLLARARAAGQRTRALRAALARGEEAP